MLILQQSAGMKHFTNEDIENYYDQTEVHYRIHWKLDEGMGLHYGIWNNKTRTLAEAVLNTNHQLMTLGGVQPTDYLLDAGCGVGGSSIYLAREAGCTVHGITLSKKQVQTATAVAAKAGLSDKVSFSQQDYTATNFADNTFDKAWCIESMETARDKALFFKEMQRIIKPGGKILIGDIFKPQPYNIDDEKQMQIMLNGWAMTDILSVDQLHSVGGDFGFNVVGMKDVTKDVKRSVDTMYVLSVVGGVFSEAYNLFIKKASYFSRIHYKTGLAQKKAYYKGRWGYYLFVLQKQ